uniref:SEA domain-containing protein n=1 Tax=Anopheles farauti TaxID=69004 RepID=A0A182QZJ4_9DIPT
MAWNSARDSDLVFEDEKPTVPSNIARLMDIENQENLRLFASQSKTALDRADESSDESSPLGSEELSYVSDDVEQLDDDDDEEDETDNEVSLRDDEEASDQDQEQSWLMRNVKRFKRSLDNLWGVSKSTEGKSEDGEHNSTKQGKHKKKATGKPRKHKNSKKSQLTKEERQQRREQNAAAAAAVHHAPQTSSARSADSGVQQKLPVAHNSISALEGKSSKLGGIRPKRQFDDTLDDTEGSGFEGSGDSGPGDENWTTYKMTITLNEPFQSSMNDPHQNSNRLAHVKALVKRLIDDALRTDFDVTAKRFAQYPSNDQLTLVVLDLNAPKDFNLDEMEDRIREQLQSGYNELRPDGLSLVLRDADDADETILERIPENEQPDEELDEDDDDPEDDDYTPVDGDERYDDEETPFPQPPFRDPVIAHDGGGGGGGRVANRAGGDEQPFPRPLFRDPVIAHDGGGGGVHHDGGDHNELEPITQDGCRGDDRVPCGQTSVYICAVQQCDGHPDCPNGEDESADRCPNTLTCKSDEFSCDSGTCIPLSQRCDGHPDCENERDEENCAPKGK